ncbi:transporter substrate-binding domain-containing protein [Clostridiaceae bacterium 35-E11]
MRKKVYYLFFFLILSILINQITHIKYDLNLWEYVKYSKPLSEEEKLWLKNKGKIIYASDRNAPPISFLEKENGQYKGIVIDYVTALSIELGADIEFHPLVWEEVLNSLLKGEVDVGDVFPSEERKKSYRFSKPIYKLRGIILVSAKEREIDKIEHLRGKKIALPRGDYAKEHLDKTIPNVVYVFTKDIHHALKLLQQGKVRAVVGDEPVITYFTNQMGIKDSTRIIEHPLYEKDVALAVAKSEEKLLNILNKGILSLQKKDFVKKIQQRWFGISASIVKNKIADSLIIGVSLFFVVTLIAVFFLYLWNHALKEEVKRRTEELYQSRRELEITFDALSHFLVVICLDGKIKNCNQSFQNYLGKKRKEVIGSYFLDWEILKTMNEKLHIFESGKIQVIKEEKEMRYRKKHYTINTFSLETIKQELPQILIVIKDITDFKIIEKQLLQENKMVAVGQLAAGVAHEIRNPLGLIRNYCYVVKNIVIEEKGLRAIQVIESSVQKIGRIIENLLDFSRISGDTWNYVDIENTIAKILELEQKNMQKKKIQSKLFCDKNLIYYTNEEALKHIVINLIDNAISAISGEGSIHIFCKKIEQGIVLTFKDSGSGIREEDVEYIFNPFFTTKTTKEATGLGLYIVYNEVQKLGGKIKVDSQYKIGTTFEIFLPEKTRMDGYEGF